MFLPGRGNFLLALIAGCLLAACGDSPPEGSTTPADASNKPATPKGEGLPPQMVAAVSAGNSSSIISVHFMLGAPPTVNKALPVDIAIVPHREFVSVRAHFDGPEGLALTVGEALDPVTSITPEKAIKHQLVLLPGKEGVYMVTAAVETEGQEGTVTRIFSIPVIVSSVAPPPVAAPAATQPAKPEDPATN